MPITPLISAAHNIKTALVRSISMTSGYPAVNDAPGLPSFYVSLSQSGTPRGFKYSGAVGGLSPRQTPPAMLRHATRLTGPSEELGVGFRVSLLSYGVYELLDNGINLTTGPRIVGIEYACSPIEDLYPFSGVISDMDGHPTGTVSLSIWNPVETHDVNAGEFEDYDGEAPIEYAAILMRNVDVMVGTTRYRVTASEPDFSLMVTRLRLRKADEPLAP